MAMTRQEEAEVRAEVRKFFDELCGTARLPRPRVVIREGGPVRDADVHVSRDDPNGGGRDTVVRVRRPDWVTIDVAAYEAQVEQRAAERQRRKEADPFGLYGPLDD
jgi:hypothetical protein